MRQIFGPECFLLREGGAGDHNTVGDFHPEIICAFSHEVKQHTVPSDHRGGIKEEVQTQGISALG